MLLHAAWHPAVECALRQLTRCAGTDVLGVLASTSRLQMALRRTFPAAAAGGHPVHIPPSDSQQVQNSWIQRQFCPLHGHHTYLRTRLLATPHVLCRRSSPGSLPASQRGAPGAACGEQCVSHLLTTTRALQMLISWQPASQLAWSSWCSLRRAVHLPAHPAGPETLWLWCNPHWASVHTAWLCLRTSQTASRFCRCKVGADWSHAAACLVLCRLRPPPAVLLLCPIQPCSACTAQTRAHSTDAGVNSKLAGAASV